MISYLPSNQKYQPFDQSEHLSNDVMIITKNRGVLTGDCMQIRVRTKHQGLRAEGFFADYQLV